eukprot:6197797-Prymnesium_polylepis.1
MRGRRARQNLLSSQQGEDLRPTGAIGAAHLIHHHACSVTPGHAAAMTCRTATPDDAGCFPHVEWAQLIGLAKHPEWYPGLTQRATFEDVQRHLHRTPAEFAKYGCPEPCAPPPWEDPLVTSRNKERPRATFVPFESAERAAEFANDRRDAASSGRVQYLTGPPTERSWRFHFAPKIHLRPSLPQPAQRITAFYSDAFNDSTRALVPVPSNWELL